MAVDAAALAAQKEDAPDAAKQRDTDADKAPAAAEPPQGKPVGLRDLYRFADGRDWLLLIVGLLAVVVSGANQPAQLFVFGRILDNFNLVDRAEIQAKIHFFALMYALLGVLLFVTTALQIACFSAVAAVQVRRMRARYFSALLRRPPSFIDEQGGGALATSVLESTTVIGAGLGEDFAQTLQRVIAFITGIGLAMYISWKLTLVVMAGIPLLAGLVAFANKAYSSATKDSSKHAESASSTAMELIAAIRTVVSLGHEPRALSTYEEASQAAAASGIQQGKARAMLEGAMAPIMFFMFGLGLWYGSKLVSDDMAENPACRYVSPQGQLQDPDATQCSTGGNIMTAFLSILFGFLGLLQALPGLSALTAATASARAVFAIIDGEAGEADPMSTRGESPPVPEGRIELSEVVFAYPGRRDNPVYKGLSLTIDAGQTVALAGPSGCGKSTLVGLLERFYEVDAGRILLDGKDIRSLNLKWLRSQIGLVSQEPVLFEGTIGSNICLGRPGALQADIQAAALKANAHDFVSKFPEGYDTFVGEKGVQLSGGQKQRIAIARAVVRDPLILVLDEATSALDTQSEAIVQAALDELLKSKRRTTIIIAHRLSTIREADKIVVISGGVVVEEGSHDQLMAKPQGTYRSLAADSGGQASTVASETGDANPTQDGTTKSGGATPATATTEATMGPGDPEAGGAEADVAATVTEVDKNAPTPMKWLLGLTAPEKFYYVSGLLGSAITGLALPAIGFLMAEFIIVFFNPDVAAMRRESRFWALVFMGFGLANSLGAILRQYSFAVITERMVVRVRTRAFHAILRQNIAWFDSSPSHTAGALVNQLSNDCFMVKALTGERASIAISQVVVLGAGLYIAFDASWQLTLIMFGIIPLIVVPVALQAKVVTKYAAQATEATVDSGRLISETLLQMRTVAAFGLEGRRVEELSAGLSFPMMQDRRKGVAAGVGTGVAAGVILLAASFQYFIGGIFIDQGIIEFGDIMRVVLVLIFMAFGMNSVSRDATDKSEAMVAAKRIFKLVNTPSSIDVFSCTGPVPTDVVEGRVELRDVHFAYPARRDLPVYKGVNLSIEAGTVVALAGPSGCGKSTLVGLLERFYDVDAGQLLLDGKDVRSLDLRWLRSRIGLVSQEPTLFSGTIRWNIGLGKQGATDEEVERSAVMSNADSFVAELPQGYDTRVGEKGLLLSGGQKQRIAIARAIVRNPAILVLDEATSALDSESERVVQAALDELMAKQKRTTIVIAHRLSTIRNATKICVFKDGVLAEEGPHDELMRKEGGTYHALVMHDQAGSAAKEKV